MRKYKTEQQTFEHCIEMICDICGLKSDSQYSWPDQDEFEVGEVEIRFKEGVNYGSDGGSGTEYNPDICPKCFKEKVIPALEGLGCITKFRKWSY